MPSSFLTWNSSMPFQEEILVYIQAPETSSAMVLRHNGGQRGKKVIDALKKACVPSYTFEKVKYPKR